MSETIVRLTVDDIPPQISAVDAIDGDALVEAASPTVPPSDLPEEDGIPLETNWHRVQINLLVESIKQRWRGRSDFFAAGNMFIYYSAAQARDRDYRGPDFFLVKGVDGQRIRGSWVVWEEEERYPDVIVELLSPSTADVDRGVKKHLYEQAFRTPNYFCYDPYTNRLEGWLLIGTRYQPLTPDANGRLWSSELSAWVGPWTGVCQQISMTWCRLFEADGALILTEAEAEASARLAAEGRAEAERQRAEAEAAARRAAESRAEQLAAKLRALGIDPDHP